VRQPNVAIAEPVPPRVLVAMIPPIIALLTQLALSSYFRPSVWFLLYPAVFLSACIGGLRAALIASVLSAAVALWAFVPPMYSFEVSPGQYIASGVFVATGVLFGVFLDRVRRASEAADRASKERRIFMALIENSSDFIGIADANGKPVYLNPAGRRMVGFASDRSVEDTEILDYYPEAQRRFAKDVIVKSMVEAGHWQGETEFRHWQTGAAIPVSDTHFMIRDPDTGEVLGMATVTRDISDIQQARRELGASLEDLSRAQSVAKVGSWRFVAGGRLEVQCSDEMYRIFGLPLDTPRMTYDTFLACVHPDDRAYVDREWSAALRGQTYDIEHRIIVDGVIKWVREKADLELDDCGNLRCCIGITHDITDLKRAEQEARRAIESRDDVLGIVAHDLRNPLGAILMQAELLMHVGNSYKAAESIQRSATRMGRLIDDLLDIARIEQGQLSMHRARVAAGHTIAEVVSAHEAHVAAASVQLDVAVAPNLPPVWADRDRLLQILENLIGNAIKFTKAGGIITVGAALRAGEMMFWVADTGAGIAADDLPHVFDRFWQAHKGRRSGAGLGLLIAKGLVEAHGGRIWVDSTRGRGTTVQFTIPTVDDARREASQRT
jgi:PAS domain S-box-containing protein